MKKLLFALPLFILLCSCAHNHSINQAIQASDNWWRGIENENPNFYQIVPINDSLVIHLCGSRARMFVEFNKIHPDRPLIDLLSDSTYMFTINYPSLDLSHMWLVVKIQNGKAILHKWATGHEFIRFLFLHSSNILSANRY